MCALIGYLNAEYPLLSTSEQLMLDLPLNIW